MGKVYGEIPFSPYLHPGDLSSKYCGMGLYGVVLLTKQKEC